MEASGSIADMTSVAHRDRQDSANSLDIAARSTPLFSPASGGGGGVEAGARPRGLAGRIRTASNNGLRQQSEAAAVGLLERQVGAVARRRAVTFACSLPCMLNAAPHSEPLSLHPGPD